MSAQSESVVVYGRNGIAMRQAKAIAKALGLEFIVEEFRYQRAGNLYPGHGCLLISYFAPPPWWRTPVMTVEQGMRLLRQGAQHA